MKAVIFAGGLGTRLSEATTLIPKPMVEIGGKPILWHIMKTYSHYGINDFIICCGYKQYVIKEYFANYFRHNCDMTVNLKDNSVEILENNSEDWRVTMIDTGLHTQTGGRLKRVQKFVGRERFLLTYGDGVTDLDIADTIQAHERSGCLISVTAYKPVGKFGALHLDLETGKVNAFQEKPDGDRNWVNASQRCLTIFPQETTPSSLSVARWSGLPRRARWWPIGTRVSGNPWTRCETTTS